MSQIRVRRIGLDFIVLKMTFIKLAECIGPFKLVLVSIATVKFLTKQGLKRTVLRFSPIPRETHLNRTAATVIHQIADVSWLNACTNE